MQCKPNGGPYGQVALASLPYSQRTIIFYTGIIRSILKENILSRYIENGIMSLNEPYHGAL